VCEDPRVRDAVTDALSRVGVTIDHHQRIPPATRDVALIVVDRATRQAEHALLRGSEVPVVVVGDDLDDDGLITLMLRPPVSHLVRDPTDRDLGITSEKLVSGDLFGLEKYVAWGAAVRSYVLEDASERDDAVATLARDVVAAGLPDRIGSLVSVIADELIANALYIAPIDDAGARFETELVQVLAQDSKTPRRAVHERDVRGAA